VQAVALERGAAPGRYLPGYLEEHLRVTAYFQLRVGVQTEFQEPEQVMEVYLPVPFGVQGQGQIDPGQFTGHALIYECAVIAVSPPLALLQPGPDLPGEGGVQGFSPALLVVRTLEGYIPAFGDVKIVFHHRIAAGYFVEPGGTVTDPLAGHKDGELYVKSEYDLLKRRCMFVPQKIVDKPRVFPVGPGPGPIGDTGRLNHPFIPSQVVHKPDKSLIQRRKLPVKYRFGFFYHAVGHERSFFKLFYNTYYREKREVNVLHHSEPAHINC
jgi:hypothetical protein